MESDSSEEEEEYGTFVPVATRESLEETFVSPSVLAVVLFRYQYWLVKGKIKHPDIYPEGPDSKLSEEEENFYLEIQQCVLD